MRILITGGAGYVGSVSVERLLVAGHEVVVLDDLSTGHRTAADGARLVEGTYADGPVLVALLEGERIEAILHCAARSLVPESIVDPARYYRDNVAGGVALLEATDLRIISPATGTATQVIASLPKNASPAQRKAALQRGLELCAGLPLAVTAVNP